MLCLRVGIIDADLISRKRHRFPNLACMKISAYWKEQGADVDLLLSYDDIENYESVVIRLQYEWEGTLLSDRVEEITIE